MVLFVVHSIGFYYDICFSFGPVNTPVVITLKCLPVLCLTLISLVISALLFLLPLCEVLSCILITSEILGLIGLSFLYLHGRSSWTFI